MARGRPRRPDIESRVLSMLAKGMPIGVIASKAGIHRNTVALIRHRMPDIFSDEAHAALINLRALEEKRQELERQEREAKEQLRRVRLVSAARTLLGSLERTIRDAEHFQSGWTATTVDADFFNGLNFSDALASVRDLTKQLKEELRNAQRKQ